MWAWLSVLLLNSAPMLAEERAEVAVVGLHIAGLDQAAAGRAAERIATAIEENGRVTALFPADVSRRIAGREDLILANMAQERGKQLLAKARFHNENAEPDKAIPLLEAATTELTRGLSVSTDVRPLVEALLLLGWLHDILGDPEAAEAVFTRAVILDPKLLLTTEQYPPNVVERFMAARRAVLAQEPGGLRITAANAEVDIFVDGRAAGRATPDGPVRVSDLLAGEHVLLARGPGGQRDFITIPVRRGQLTLYEVQLKQALYLGGTQAETGTEPVRDLYSALCASADADFVLLGGEVAGDQVGLQLYARRSGAFSRSMLLPADGDAIDLVLDLLPSLLSYVDATGDLKPGKTHLQVLPLDLNTNTLLTTMLLDPPKNVPVAVTPPEVQESHWLLWTGASVVAAGGGTAAALLLTRNRGTIVFGEVP